MRKFNLFALLAALSLSLSGFAADPEHPAEQPAKHEKHQKKAKKVGAAMKHEDPAMAKDKPAAEGEKPAHKTDEGKKAE